MLSGIHSFALLCCYDVYKIPLFWEGFPLVSHYPKIILHIVVKLFPENVPKMGGCGAWGHDLVVNVAVLGWT